MFVKIKISMKLLRGEYFIILMGIIFWMVNVVIINLKFKFLINWIIQLWSGNIPIFMKIIIDISGIIWGL